MNNFFLFSNFIANYRIAYKLHNRSFICRYNKWLLKIIETFFNYNLITNYNLIDGSYVYIKIKYYPNTKRPLIESFNLLSKPSKKVICKFKDLKYYTRKYDLILISNSKGLFFVNKKISKNKLSKMGGLLLVGINL